MTRNKILSGVRCENRGNINPHFGPNPIDYHMKTSCMCYRRPIFIFRVVNQNTPGVRKQLAEYSKFPLG